MQPFNQFPDASRVWIYVAAKPITSSQLTEINQVLEDFAERWTAHNQALKAYAKVHDEHFVVLMVDETQAGASGCSIDTSVRFIQQLEQDYQLVLLDRMIFAYQKDHKAITVNAEELATLYRNGEIEDRTLVYNPLIQRKSDFESKWLIPLEDSWHKRMV